MSAELTAPAALDVDALTEARAAVTVGVWVSATRCLVTYLVAPSLGLLGSAVGAAGLVLQVLGVVTSVAGARRLRSLGSRWWLAYAVVSGVVVLATVIAVLDVLDVLDAVGRPA